MSKILIIGRLAPPIGGVTMHVSRLINSLKDHGFMRFNFVNLRDDSFGQILKSVISSRVIHLHVSNPFVQCMFAIFCCVCFKTLILTYHGNWGRYRLLGNWAVCLSAFFSTIPIVQNAESLKQARYWNRNAKLVSTFISSSQIIPLRAEHEQQLTEFCRNYAFIFCTNAWNLVFDKFGNELYGISRIIASMQQTDSIGLVISDPSENYMPFIRKTLGQIPNNILFLQGDHDFRSVLQVCDAFVRNTTTDGVSLSIYEARELGVMVLASNAVSRPDFCHVYDDIAQVDWIKELKKGESGRKKLDKTLAVSTVCELIKIYQECLSG